MFNDILTRIRKARTAVENHPITTELRSRENTAFSLLDPQVRIIKNSPTVQIVFGCAVSGLMLTGNVTMAAILTSCWFGSKPLTHVAAAGVAGVGMVDRELMAGIERLQAMVEPGPGLDCP